MTKTPISADTLKLVQARRALEAEKAAEKARAKEAKKKPELAAKVSLEEISDAPKEPSPAKNKRYIAHQIDTPADLLLAHRPDLKLYKWQAETLFQLAGYTDINDLDLPKTRPTDKTPLYYNLVAANGSGKDQVVISSFAVWFCLSKVRSRCVITSSSYEQLKDQTYKYIKNICEEINVSYGRKVFEIVEFLITCNDTGSEIKCFVTDDPGKAEGRHPFDEPGAEMAVIVNEAKSITDEMFQAFSRFTGYNYWLEISSPGKNSGHFFKRCTRAKYAFPDPLEIGEFYWRRVTAFDCPHLLGKHIEHLKDEHGEQSLIYRSQVLAEFTSLDEAAFIPSTLFENYPNNPPRTFGLPNRAGIDLSLGGDETVAYFFVHGNSTYEQQRFVTRQFSTIRSSVGLKNLTSRPLRYALTMAVWDDLSCSECKMQVMTSCRYETKPDQPTQISTRTEALKTGIVLSVLLKTVRFLHLMTTLLANSYVRVASLLRGSSRS